MGDSYTAHHSFSRKLAIKNCWGKDSLKRQHQHHQCCSRGCRGRAQREADRSQPLVATDDISCDGSKEAGGEMGAALGLKLLSLPSICKVKMLSKSSDAQGKCCLGS